MKVEFEFDRSYKGQLTIDGKEMTVDMKPGETRLNGISPYEIENTLGGIVAESLFGKLADVMQAWAIASENYSGDTWEVIHDEDIAGDIAERVL